jgi:putative transposase
MGHGQPTGMRRGVESVELSSDGRMPGTARVSRDPGVPRPHDAARGWRSRYYLPHYDEPGALQTITFRLADSLPAEVLSQMEEEIKGRRDASVERRKRLQILIDAGYGACHLREPNIARLVEDSLLYFDGERYRLLAWTVMPNHVHVLIETTPQCSLEGVIRSWKSFTAHQGNKLLGRTGAFWHPDYFDRAIRDGRHFLAAVEYIENNRVKAGLVPRAQLWPFGSVRLRCARPGTRETRAVPGIRRHAYPP